MWWRKLNQVGLRNVSEQIAINHFWPIATYIPGRTCTGFSFKNKFRSVCIKIITGLILKIYNPQNDSTYYLTYWQFLYSNFEVFESFLHRRINPSVMIGVQLPATWYLSYENVTQNVVVFFRSENKLIDLQRSVFSVRRCYTFAYTQYPNVQTIKRLSIALLRN